MRRDRSRSRDRKDSGSNKLLDKEDIAVAARNALLSELNAEKEIKNHEMAVKNAKASGHCINYMKGRCDKGDGKKEK